MANNIKRMIKEDGIVLEKKFKQATTRQFNIKQNDKFKKRK